MCSQDLVLAQGHPQVRPSASSHLSQRWLGLHPTVVLYYIRVSQLPPVLLSTTEPQLQPLKQSVCQLLRTLGLCVCVVAVVLRCSHTRGGQRSTSGVVPQVPWFSRLGLSSTCNSPRRLGWLASEPQGSACVCLGSIPPGF